MRIQRIITRQGHPVPQTAHNPRGPFPPEILAPPKIVTDYLPEPDGGGPEVPVDGTAQNGFRPTKWFRCVECGEAVREPELDQHECEWYDQDEEE